MANPITPADLLDRCRRELDDLPYASNSDEGLLWSDADIYHYMDLAQQELVKHVGYLRKEVELTVTAGTATVDLPEDVVDVFSVYSVGQNANLHFANRNSTSDHVFDDYGLRVTGRWRGQTGDPREFLLDMLNGQIFLLPEPVDNDTLKVLLSTLPARITGDVADVFSFNRPDHAWSLLPYMKYLAYSKHDADAYDPNLSEKYRRLAEDEFRRVYSEVQKLRQSNAPGSGTTRYGGIPF